MGGQSLCFGQALRGGGNSLSFIFAQAKEADDFGEVADVQRTGKPSRPHSRHNVGRAGCIISQDFVGMFTQENAAGVFHQANQCPRICDV